MMEYRCCDCEHYFEQPHVHTVKFWDDAYGARQLCEESEDQCPFCGSTDFDQINLDDESEDR